MQNQAQNFDFQDFDNKWSLMGKEICQAIYINPKAQALKQALQKNGFLTLEEKSAFIDLCDKIKYEVIYSKVGPEGTSGYKDFSENWKSWFQKKGVESQKDRSQRSGVDHILFGSTPDPAPFLLHFEQEMLGSMRPAK